MKEQEIKVITKCELKDLGRVIDAIMMIKGVIKVHYTTDDNCSCNETPCHWLNSLPKM